MRSGPKKKTADTRRPGRKRIRSGLWMAPVLVVGLTFLLRLWFLLEMRDTPFSTVSLQMLDPWYYHLQALDILERSFIGTEVFFLRPLYPYLLAGVYALFGRSLLAVQILQALLGAGSGLLLYDGCRRLFGRTAALVAGFGFAVTGILIFYTGTLLYVELTVFLSVLFAWLLIIETDRWWRWLGAGLSLGLLVICRPEFLLLLPTALFVLVRRRARARPVMVMAGAALAVIALVPVRNFAVARDPVLFTAHSGINFYYGNNPAADGTWQPAPELEAATGFSHERLKQAARVVAGRKLSWSQASNHWLRRGLNWLAANPGPALRLLGRKFLRFWSDYEVPGNYYPETARSVSLVLRFLLPVGFGLSAALGLVGMVLAWPLRRRAWPVYGFIALHLLSVLAFYVLSRLRAPVLPFFLMFAGYAVSRGIAAFRAGRYGRLVIGVAAAGAILAGTRIIPADRGRYTAQAWTQWGNILLAERKVGRAEESFERALDADPANPSARYSLIVLLAGSGRAEPAAGHYQELVRRSTGPHLLPLRHLAGGRLAIAERKFEQAAVEYRAAIAADPGNPEPWYMLGLVYIELNRPAEARSALTQALTLDPTNAEARAALEILARRN